ncbi:hypothetical protein QOT17_008242 [Balamuthia mandrillaris]
MEEQLRLYEKRALLAEEQLQTLLHRIEALERLDEEQAQDEAVIYQDSISTSVRRGCDAKARPSTTAEVEGLRKERDEAAAQLRKAEYRTEILLRSLNETERALAEEREKAKAYKQKAEYRAEILVRNLNEAEARLHH